MTNKIKMTNNSGAQNKWKVRKSGGGNIDKHHQPSGHEILSNFP
jgi:hypothetical protein